MASLIVSNIIAIVIAAIGSNGIGVLILKRKWEKKDKRDEEFKEIIDSIKEIQKVVDILLYHELADKLEYYRVRGFASLAEKDEVNDLHEIYHERGFNGNMDARMTVFYQLPTERK